jgi:hypothetical protein
VSAEEIKWTTRLGIQPSPSDVATLQRTCRAFTWMNGENANKMRHYWIWCSFFQEFFLVKKVLRNVCIGRLHQCAARARPMSGAENQRGAPGCRSLSTGTRKPRVRNHVE